MDNIFFTAAVISVIFLIIKFIEMRFISKETIPLKKLVMDCLVVYFSVIIGYYVLEQVTPVIEKTTTVIPPVFTDNPDF